MFIEHTQQYHHRTMQIFEGVLYWSGDVKRWKERIKTIHTEK